MSSSKTLLSLSLLAISTLLPSAEALGCYGSGGFLGLLLPDPYNYRKFSTLHSDYSTERDINTEFHEDLITRCRKVDGAQAAYGKAWSDCSEWAIEEQDFMCKNKCLTDCGNEGDVGKCVLTCQNNCPWVSKGDFKKNHIDWSIKHDMADHDTRTLSFDTCMAGFANIYDTCRDYGGELNYGGFWFRLDPNSDKCA
ncbi:hypothetical protein MBLNU13_g04260t1 [Cladosporium sp. NU13]